MGCRRTFMHITIMLLLCVGCHRIMALHLTAIYVPEVADYRDTVTLSCSYDMGTHTLNSVKWYKDDMEFFRYTPMMYPSIVRFTVNGVTTAWEIFSCDKSKCKVNLEHLGRQTSGAYRCEISGDAPEFKLVSKTAHMTVAALPRYDPDVKGIASKYAFGDVVAANCTSDKSSLPASLRWFINDEEALPEYIQSAYESTNQTDKFLMRYRSSEIRFRIDKLLMANVKQLSVKCVVQMDRFPSLVRDKINKIDIVSTDDVANQKLVNWRNSACKIQTAWHSLTVITLFIFILRLLTVNNCENVIAFTKRI